MKTKIGNNKKTIGAMFIGVIIILVTVLSILYGKMYKPIEDKFTEAFPHPVSIFEMTEEESEIHAEMLQKGGEKLNREQQIILVDNMALMEEARYRAYDEEDTVNIGKYYKGAGRVEEAKVEHDSIHYIIRTDGGHYFCLLDSSDVRAIRDINPNSYIEFYGEGWGSEEHEGVDLPKLFTHSIKITKKVD